MEDCCIPRLPNDSVHVVSMVSAKTKEPLVQLYWPDGGTQLTVAKARELGMRIMEAAEAALTDAFMIDWLSNTVFAGKPDALQGAAVMLAEMRKYREGQGDA